MTTDASRTPDGDDDEPDEDDQDVPFEPKQDDDTPLGDTDQHSDADA